MRNKQEERTTRKIGRHEMFEEVRRKGDRRLRWKSVDRMVGQACAREEPNQEGG